MTFRYDSYTATRRLVVRAVELLDYTPGGPDFDANSAAGDIGAADELHGEAGDDIVYGMKGSDVLFGEGQDDQLVGGWGADWISGGTGEDGILGDDGRISVSRNSSTYGESLYGVLAIPAGGLDLRIATPGNLQQAISNPAGVLKYTVDLTPANVDPASSANPLFRPLHANDVIYGGWGDDSIHGGAGDDAISGAEAPAEAWTNTYSQSGAQVGDTVRSDYTRPFNPGNVLGYSPTTTLLAQYDPNNGLRKVLVGGAEWLLGFTAAEGLVDGFWIQGQSAYSGVATDGDDHIFGDLGHDWLVGGTGRDTLWGGWGDDLLNADDRLTATIETDTNPSYEDLAYGGAGRDVLIANTGGDRLIDWAGEFNSYLTPFSPFGMMTVSRMIQPQLPEFLAALGKSQGADQTLTEPFGELGIVRQQDAAWGDQNGSPRDPQAGNSKGARDVLRTSGTLLLDAAAPVALAADSLPDPVAPSLVAPTTASSTVAFTATGPTGSTITYDVSDGAATVGGTAVVSDGSSITLSTPTTGLEDGSLTFTARVMDILGNVELAASVSARKDTVAPRIDVAAATAATDAGRATARLTAGMLGASASDETGAATLDVSGLPAGDEFALGTTTLTYTATDAAGNVTVVTQAVTVVDREAPSVSAPGAVSRSNDPGEGFATISDSVLGAPGVWDNAGGVTITRTGVPAGNRFGIGTTLVTYSVADAAGNTTTVTQAVTVTLVGLYASAPAPGQRVKEGGAVVQLGTFGDSAPGSSWTVTVNWGDGTTSSFTTGTLGALSATHAYANDGVTPYGVTVTIKNGARVTDSATFAVTVDNVAPTVTISTPAMNTVYAVGGFVSVIAQFADAGKSDTHTCRVEWGNGKSSTGTVSYPKNGSPRCSATANFVTAGVYTIVVTVTDGVDAGEARVKVGVGADPTVSSLSQGPAISSSVTLLQRAHVRPKATPSSSKSKTKGKPTKVRRAGTPARTLPSRGSRATAA